MENTKYDVKLFIRNGIEVEISYLKFGILFFWNFSVLGNKLSLGILNKNRDNEPLLNGPDNVFVPFNLPLTYLCLSSC